LRNTTLTKDHWSDRDPCLNHQTRGSRPGGRESYQISDLLGTSALVGGRNWC
jgi:hypothetical protein